MRALWRWLACEDGKGVIKGIGKVLGAIPAGVGHALATSGIPLVSNLGGVAEGLGRSFQGKQGFLKGVLPALATGLGGAGLFGAGPLGGLLGGIGKLGGGFLKSGIGKLLPGLLGRGGGGGGGAGGVDAMGNPVSAAISGTDVSGMAPGGGGDTGGILGKVLGFIGKNPLQAGQLGLAGMNAVNANKLRGQQFDLMNDALKRVGGTG